MDEAKEKLDDFMTDYIAAQSTSYYSRFWANTAMANGLTVKYDGKEFLCKPEKIKVVDLGEMIGQCLCKHAIRYEFWFDTLGPIGSSCIKTMTGLDGQDLRMLIKGAELAKKDGQDLDKTIETYKTFHEQMEVDDILKVRYLFVHMCDKIPQAIQKFVEQDIPLPIPMKNLLYRIYNAEGKVLKVKEMYGEEIYEMALTYKDFNNLYGEKPPKFIETINDIGAKIIEMKATGKAVDHFKRLYIRAKNTRFMDAYGILLLLQTFDLGEFWNDLIQKYIKDGELYGLSDGQIKLVLDGSSTGKPSLSERFKEKLLTFEEIEDPGVENLNNRREAFFNKRNVGERGGG